ncbi:MAG: hypothetical protein SVW57_12595 [Thermodesulfobacteriota bacterium]|nr:hypothetical protein [Thermodesulfobacteriota bacterium]
MELTDFLGRGWYEHGQGDVNHCNGSYDRNFTLKGIGGMILRLRLFHEVNGMKMSLGKM